MGQYFRFRSAPIILRPLGLRAFPEQVSGPVESSSPAGTGVPVPGHSAGSNAVDVEAHVYFLRQPRHDVKAYFDSVFFPGVQTTAARIIVEKPRFFRLSFL